MLRCVALCCAVCSSVALCCAVMLCYELFCCVVFCCVVCKAKSKDKGYGKLVRLG